MSLWLSHRTRRITGRAAAPSRRHIHCSAGVLAPVGGAGCAPRFGWGRVFHRSEQKLRRADGRRLAATAARHEPFTHSARDDSVTGSLADEKNGVYPYYPPPRPRPRRRSRVASYECPRRKNAVKSRTRCPPACAAARTNSRSCRVRTASSGSSRARPWCRRRSA